MKCINLCILFISAFDFHNYRIRFFILNNRVYVLRTDRASSSHFHLRFVSVNLFLFVRQRRPTSADYRAHVHERQGSSRSIFCKFPLLLRIDDKTVCSLRDLLLFRRRICTHECEESVLGEKRSIFQSPAGSFKN